MKSDHKKSVTLEDLLRLKRAERPPAEFWSRFERELRAKQLAAIVARRPWWSELPRRAFAQLARYHLPLGATAVLAVTFISLKHYQPAESGPALAASLSAMSEAPSPTTSTSASTSSSNDLAASAPSSSTVSTSTREEPAAPANLASATSSESSTAPTRVLSGDVSAMNALLGVSGRSDREASIASPSAPLPGANFATLPNLEAPLTPAIFGEKRGFENRVLPARSVDPLATVTPPDRVRSKRYQPVAAFPATEPARVVSARSSDRIVRGMSDDRLYETSSRLGFGGSRLDFKF